MKVKKKYVINVTATDIKRGTPMIADTCPVARALRRKWPGALVGANEFWIGIRGAVIKTPRAVAAFIRRFDEDEKVEPMSFTVTV